MGVWMAQACLCCGGGVTTYFPIGGWCSCFLSLTSFTAVTAYTGRRKGHEVSAASWACVGLACGVLLPMVVVMAALFTIVAQPDLRLLSTILGRCCILMLLFAVVVRRVLAALRRDASGTYACGCRSE